MQDSSKKLNGSLWFSLFPRVVGAITAFYGLFVIISWYAHWRLMVQVVPETSPMHFNTALCFVFSGTALGLLTLKRNQASLWPVSLSLILSFLTLLEYITGRNLNIDEFFFKHYF